MLGSKNRCRSFTRICFGQSQVSDSPCSKHTRTPSPTTSAPNLPSTRHPIPQTKSKTPDHQITCKLKRSHKHQPRWTTQFSLDVFSYKEKRESCDSTTQSTTDRRYWLKFEQLRMRRMEVMSQTTVSEAFGTFVLGTICADHRCDGCRGYVTAIRGGSSRGRVVPWEDMT